MRPDVFAEELSEANRATDGRLTPTIMLAKAMADCHIRHEDRKISGYHMEALAIDAFRSYSATRDSRSMLAHLFGHAIRAVLSPIPDSTGQSRHVDEYLAPSGSGPRQRASTYFGQMRGNVRRCTTTSQFNRLVLPVVPSNATIDEQQVRDDLRQRGASV